MNTRHTAVVIPAGGMCTRMGDFKPLLPLGEKTVIARAITPFHAAGLKDILVVVGHRAADLISYLDNTGVNWVHNPRFAEGMFSSVKVAMGALPADTDAFFILPADMPLVRASTLSTLLDAGTKGVGKIWYPTFEGVRGHPPLISAAYREQIQPWGGEGGLGGFLQGEEAEAADVPVADAGVLFDLDTPADYRQACVRVDNWQLPTAAECLALMRIRFGPDAPVIGHCRAVSQIALELASMLNHAGCSLDRRLIQAACLVHDVGKGVPEHAAAGARLLSSLGFPRVGNLVLEHMDLAAIGDGPIEEKELVYLADKLVRNDHPVDMEARFEDKLRRLGDDPLKRDAIARRRDHAAAVKARVEARLGQPVESALNRLIG